MVPGLLNLDYGAQYQRLTAANLRRTSNFLNRRRKKCDAHQISSITNRCTIDPSVQCFDHGLNGRRVSNVCSFRKSQSGFQSNGRDNPTSEFSRYSHGDGSGWSRRIIYLSQRRRLTWCVDLRVRNQGTGGGIRRFYEGPRGSPSNHRESRSLRSDRSRVNWQIALVT